MCGLEVWLLEERELGNGMFVLIEGKEWARNLI